MRLTIKDMQTAKTYDIGEDGAVLGRDKRNSDIPVRDESVSKQHARIYPAGGDWILEDLGSSNGTYFKNKTISQPVELYQGAVFSLAQRQFEVSFIELPEDTALEDGSEDAAALVDDIEPPPDMDGVTPVPAPQPGALEDDEDDEPASRTATARRDRKKPKAAGGEKSKSRKKPAAAAEGDDEAPAAVTVAYFMVALPKAFAYYLAAVPLLLFNPPGTIRKGIDEQKLKPMGTAELIAYAIPAYVFIGLLGQVFGFLAALVNGSFAISLLIPGLPIAVISGTVGGVIVGFIFHPVTRWLVTKLGGRSDARSRTNYAIMVFTASILAAVPNGLGSLLAALPVPFIGLLGPLLMLAATAITLFVLFSWVKAFELFKWMQYVVLALGALAVLGTVANLVNVTVSSVRSFGSGGGAEVAEGGSGELTDEQLAALEQAEKQGLSAEQIAVMRASLEAQAKAIADAAKAAAGDDADDDGKGDDDKGDDDKGDDDKGDDDKGDDDKGDDDKGDDAKDDDAKDDDAKDDDAKDDDTKDDDAKDDDAKDDAPPAADSKDDSEPLLAKPSRARQGTDFLEFVERRREIERAIQENPRLIKDRKVLRLYTSLLKQNYELAKKAQKKKTKPWEVEINKRRLDLVLFDKTRRVVDRLYSRIYGD